MRHELTVPAVLTEVRECLRTARMGHASLLSSDPARRLPGLRNIATFGVAATITLQRLRSRAAGFDKWWQEKRKVLEGDPGFRRMWDLRNEILKQGMGTSSVGVSLHLEHLNTDDLQPLLSNPPPGASSFFIGDQTGGAGWVVPMADGLEEKYYVQLPPSVKWSSAFTVNVGGATQDVKQLVHRWLTHLEGLEREARQRFDAHSS